MLIVRCPACHTVFRMRPEQLRTHGGRVRCGGCYSAFNAVEHLMDQEQIPDPGMQAQDAKMQPSVTNAPSTVPPASSASHSAPPITAADDLDFGIPEPTPTTHESPSPRHSTPEHNTQAHVEPTRPSDAEASPTLIRDNDSAHINFRPYVPPAPTPPANLFVRKTASKVETPDVRLVSPWNNEPATEPTPEQKPPTAQPVDAPAPTARYAVDEPLASATPAKVATGTDIPSPFMVHDEDPEEPHHASDTDETDDDTPIFLYHTDEPQQVQHRWLWGLMIGILAGTLAVQAAYLFREDIARKWPQTRPWYLELCTHFGCTVPLPRMASAITIESSNLESDPDNAKQFILSARVRNQAYHPQQYPHLELTLTDGRNRAVVRRVITPSEWAPGGVSEAGIAPRAEIETNVPFVATGPVSAVGYRVYAFYP